MREAARRLVGLGAKAALVKGGHLTGDAVDVLFDGREFHDYGANRIDTPHTHGTGCTYSAAITAELANGKPLVEAVRSAKVFITEAIRTNPGLGGGSGPVNHYAGTGRISRLSAIGDVDKPTIRTSIDLPASSIASSTKPQPAVDARPVS